MSIPQLCVMRPVGPDRNSTTSLKKQLSSAVSSCRICLSSVFEPACLTNCGHRFCEGCLNTYWHVNNKPEYITCPLCRGEASNISFVMKDDASMTKDFRKTFSVADQTTATSKSLVSVHNQLSYPSFFCLKMMLIPALYWIFNWLKSPFIELVNDFQMMLKQN